MKRSDIQVIPSYYDRYVALVDDVELMQTLPTDGLALFLENREQLNEIGQQIYAPNKWTVNQIVEHLMDTERLFLARALRFARKDKTNLPGYEENDYADAANSNDRTLDDLLEEFEVIRKNSTYFFKSLTDEQLMATGTGNNQEISVLAIGFIMVGHPIHHFNTIRERYVPLLNN